MSDWVNPDTDGLPEPVKDFLDDIFWGWDGISGVSMDYDYEVTDDTCTFTIKDWSGKSSYLHFTHKDNGKWVLDLSSEQEEELDGFKVEKSALWEIFFNSGDAK